MASLYPPYPPDLKVEERKALATVIREWSLSNGLAVRPAASFVPQSVDKNAALVTTAPVTLFPSLFPRSCFEEAVEIQQSYNEVYARVSSDEKLLEGVIQELGKIDTYLARLWEIHKEVQRQGYIQNLSLGIFRSDYMTHYPDSSYEQPSLRQVEFNTIASSFGGLSQRVSSLHRFLLDSQRYPNEAVQTIQTKSLPPNDSISGITAGLYYAYHAYGPAKSPMALQICIIFVVQDEERNLFDQKHLEHELYYKHHALVFRLPWSRILVDTRLDESRTLIYTPPESPQRAYEVALLYFRAGYSPDEYGDEEAWKARLHLERSAAIKCPTVLTHLAGSKKVQQILATPNSPLLSQVLPSEDRVRRVLDTFAPMYPLDDTEAGIKGQELALNPETAARHVLKPQREGGGNNIYRQAIPPFLKSIAQDQWPQYVLMEMIETPPQHNSILRHGEVQQGGVICELGVYGACLWKSGEQSSGKGIEEILLNSNAGYLLRTKADSSEEGGVAAGFGAVDSCCLIDA